MLVRKKNQIGLEKIIIILCIIPFIIIAAGIFYILTLNNILYTNVQNSIQEVSARTAEMAYERLHNTSTRLRAISYMHDITSKDIELNTKLDVLRTETKKYGWRNMFFANLDGFGTTADGTNHDISDREYFPKVLQGQTITSDFLLAKDPKGSKEHYVVHAVPVIAQNKKIIGVLIAIENIQDLHFAQSKENKNALASEFLFVDKHGFFVENGDISQKTLFEKIAEENNFSSGSVDMDFLKVLSAGEKTILFKGDESYISVNPIGDTGWNVVGIISSKASMKQVDYIWFFSIVLITGTFITLLFCFHYLWKMRKVYVQYKTFSNAVVDAQGIFYLYIDNAGCVHFANPYFYEHLGHENTNDLLQILDYMDDMDAENLKTLLQSGENFTLHIHPKNASPFHMQCTTFLHEDRKDLWVMLGTDLSAYHNSLEAELAKTQTVELQQIINSIPYPLLVHSKDGTRLANKAVLEILGFDDGFDMSGLKSVRGNIMQGMSAEAFQHQAELLNHALTRGESGSGTFEYKLQNSEVRTYRNILSPVFDENGQIKYAINVGVDITEMLHLQNTLEAELLRQHEILDSSPTGFLYTCERIITYCNPTMQKMTGVELGKPIPFDKIDLLGVGLAYRDEVETGKKFNDVHVVVPGENGKERHLHISALGTTWFGKWHTLLWAHDVTDIHEAQKELIVARDAAEQAARAKSDFLATMSHEIRTPMNAVLGFLHVFEKDNLNATQLNYIDKIAISAKGLLRIINDILDFSKIEADKMDLENTPFNLLANIDAVYSIISFTAHEKNLTFHKYIDENMPQMLVGDGERLNQVLLNLLSNAVKFTNEGTVSLSVKVVEKISFNKYILQFSVSDTGIGLSKEQVSSLFQPFTQADTSTSRKFGGTGLGLAISKRLVELMGGHISLESEKGRGSTFSCTIPMQTAPEMLMAYGREGEMELVLEEETTQLSHIKGKKVLIAEDNLINQEIAAAMLEEFELKLDFVDNGQEAVEKVQEKHYDLIFMDLQMPTLNGLDATRAIRELGLTNEHFKKIPIIAMTANVMSEDRASCYEAGMNDHVGKPISPEALRAALLKWLL